MVIRFGKSLAFRSCRALLRRVIGVAWILNCLILVMSAALWVASNWHAYEVIASTVEFGPGAAADDILCARDITFTSADNCLAVKTDLLTLQFDVPARDGRRLAYSDRSATVHSYPAYSDGLSMPTYRWFGFASETVQTRNASDNAFETPFEEQYKTYAAPYAAIIALASIWPAFRIRARRRRGQLWAMFRLTNRLESWKRLARRTVFLASIALSALGLFGAVTSYIHPVKMLAGLELGTKGRDFSCIAQKGEFIFAARNSKLPDPSPQRARLTVRDFKEGTPIVYSRQMFNSPTEFPDFLPLSVSSIHSWLVAVPLAMWAAWMVVWFTAAARRQRKRARAGLCLACGYDLRASPDRCPECGGECGAINRTTNRDRSPPPDSPAVTPSARM